MNGSNGSVFPQNANTEFAEAMELWQNIQKASAIGMEIAGKYGPKEAGADIPIDPLGISEKITNAWMNMWSDPDKMVKMQTEFWGGIGDIWMSNLGLGNNAPASANTTNRRFKHSAWQENLVLSFLKSSYLFSHAWVQEKISDLPDLSEHDRIVTSLTMRNLLESFSPSNFAFTNPEVLEATLKEKGENLVRGMTMMREDFERGKGQLLIRQVDSEPFEVGKNVAVTPGKVIYENGHYQLIQYAPTTEKVNSVPILIIPPWINKFYILDLNEKKSFAKWLVAQGHTVFMVSWINADVSCRDFTWTDRLNAIDEGIDVVLKETENAKAHLISFCIGGTLTGSLLADLGKSAEDRIASSTFLTSQFDFEHAGELMAFVSEQSVELLDQFSEIGYIPAESMSNAFNLLRSNDLIWSYMVDNYMLGKTPMAFDLLYWNSDSMRMPVKIQKFYLEQFYLKNAFMKNELEINGRKVGVSTITVPSYHLAAIDDHIAPAESVFIAAKAMNSAKVRFVVGGSGHIAGVVNPPVLEKYHFWASDDISEKQFKTWISQTKQSDGSWWRDWANWIDQFESRKIAPREPASIHPAIENAPGRYVRIRFD